MENVWVKHRRYAADNTRVAEWLTDLLDTAELELQKASAMRSAVKCLREGSVDFHDGLIVSLAELRGAPVTTFDSKAAQPLSMWLPR